MKRVLVIIRQTLFGTLVRIRTARIGRGLKVNHYPVVSRKTKLGSNVNFNGMRVSDSGDVSIGNSFHSGKGCVIISSFYDYDSGEVIPCGPTSVERPVVIEDNVWLGDQVIVLGGAHIEEGAIVQAGSVVVGRVLRCSIVGGYPAKQFKTRNIALYEKLKAEGKFF